YYNWEIVQHLLICDAYPKEVDNMGKNVFHMVLEAPVPDLDLVEYMTGNDKVAKVGYKLGDSKGVTAFQVLYRRAHRSFLKRKRIGRHLKRVFYAVMNYLSRREDQGGELGRCYRELWRRSKKLKRYRAGYTL